MYNNVECGEFYIKIESNLEDCEYRYKYIGKVLFLNNNNNNKYKNTKLIIYTDKKQKLEYGDIIIAKGTFSYAKETRNSNGFNYRRSLWQKKIFGILKCDYIEKLGKEKDLGYTINKTRLKLEKNIEKSIKNEDYSNFLKGLILGDKQDISDKITNLFKNASLSHILAISGMHIGYIILIVNLILKRLNSKKIKDVLSIIIVFIYVVLIGAPPSSQRAFIMYVLYILSYSLYRKPNAFKSLISAFAIIIIQNPFYIENIGVWLSFMGTLGILLGLKKIDIRIKNKVLNFFLQNIIISIFVQIFIIPIMVYSFNSISLNFLISNIMISLFIVPILILGFCLSFFNIFLLSYFESKLLSFVFLFSKIISKLKPIIIVTPKVFYLIYYYLLLIGVWIRNKRLIKIVILLWIITVLISNIVYFSNNNLEISFLDVGQGDCTLIVTPDKKTVLIDGGDCEKFDEGENTVFPFLLDKGINELNYIIISHFDSDHVRTGFFIFWKT